MHKNKIKVKCQRHEDYKLKVTICVFDKLTHARAHTHTLQKVSDLRRQGNDRILEEERRIIAQTQSKANEQRASLNIIQ